MHGGVTDKDIERHVNKALDISSSHDKTILFFDEANTSESISLVKEILLDNTIHGKPLHFHDKCIEVIAACNPYKR